MSAIPEDVMKAAQNAWAEADNKILKTDAYVVIARAILAERERSRTALSEAERRARREALEEAAKVVETLGGAFIRIGEHPDADSKKAGEFSQILEISSAAIRALIPSEPHDAEGRE